ncbi:glycosyltransferase family 2 protein [Reichenbachiella carrageenanivorans]|uniref:Glycosyltransferase family 2 protein n=1 Tax=Reichenbachiella carrageenanivorans TaxID=2979869 RepID=A0ABY6D0V5_9BACT|nr:glycosyltransferase family A protein [Reichenbachiella carrageenanivorans]UXX79554.1 glycosyltransferase family 2 protein [Reichenbachiella carrageenanivorans]
MNTQIPIVVSLTSIQSRLNYVSKAIESILNQDVKADRVLLWLSEEPHLLDEGVREIPESLKSLERRGLEIHWTKNTGPYRKLIPTAKLMNRDHCLIVTADDDVLYPSNWLQGLIGEYQKNQDCVICYRGRIISHEESLLNKIIGKRKLKPYSKWTRTHEIEDMRELGPSLMIFPTGKDGVLYPSQRLHEELFNKSIYMNMAPTNDDIWFKAMTMITDTKVKCIEGHQDFSEIEETRDATLFRTGGNRKNNDRMIYEIFDRYNLLP